MDGLCRGRIVARTWHGGPRLIPDQSQEIAKLANAMVRMAATNDGWAKKRRPAVRPGGEPTHLNEDRTSRHTIRAFLMTDLCKSNWGSWRSAIQ